MRLPVERRRAAPLRGAGILDPGRPLPPDARRLVVAEELGKLDAERAVVFVIASEAKQSILSLRPHGLLRFARNDGERAGSRRRIDHRFLAPELLLTQENIETRADNDGCTDKG